MADPFILGISSGAGKEPGRVVPQHSHIHIGLYGQAWVQFMADCSEMVDKLLLLSPHKRPYYKKGRRAMELIGSVFWPFLSPRQVIHQFLLLALITVLIWGFKSLSNYGHDLLWRNLAQNMQHDLRLNASKERIIKLLHSQYRAAPLEV